MRQNHHFLFGFSVCLLALPSVSGDELTVFSYGVESDFTTTITSESLAGAPAWKAADANPPVSARKAIHLARDAKERLVKDSNDWKWYLVSASLKRYDPMADSPWYWLVTYEAFQIGGMTGPPRELHIAVRMDGTVVAPRPVKLPAVEFGGSSEADGTHGPGQP